MTRALTLLRAITAQLLLGNNSEIPLVVGRLNFHPRKNLMTRIEKTKILSVGVGPAGMLTASKDYRKKISHGSVKLRLRVAFGNTEGPELLKICRENLHRQPNAHA